MEKHSGKKIRKHVKIKTGAQLPVVAEYFLEALASDVPHELVISPYEKPKTLRQLGGLFGVWMPWLSEQTGYELKWLHRFYKRRYLEDIYLADPKSPVQEMWVEGMDLWQQMYNLEPTQRNADMLQNHRGRISLGWATCRQMRDYMELVDRDNLDRGRSLPILKQYEDVYRR